MHYLFGFSGRINRAKMWLFILVAVAWDIVVGMVAVFGFNWTHYMAEVRSAHESGTFITDYPFPDQLAGTGLVAACIIGLLFIAFFVAMLAVTTKRLHDRNKGAIWLIPFIFIPWGVGVLRVSAAISVLQMGQSFMPPFGFGLGVSHLVATVLSIWAFIELFFLRGTAGPNKYGADPLA